MQLWDPALSTLEDVHKPPESPSDFQLQLHQKYGAGVYQLWQLSLWLHMALGKVTMETAAVNQSSPSVLWLLTGHYQQI